MTPRLAPQARYRTLTGRDGRPVGIVLDETAPVTDPLKLERLRQVVDSDLTPLAHRGIDVYPHGFLHPTAQWWVDEDGGEYPVATAQWWVDEDGGEYPVATDLARHLLRPMVSLVATTPWLPSNFRGPRSLLVGLAAGGLVVTIIAPLASATTLAAAA